MTEIRKEVTQEHLEVIACTFNPDKKKWKCLSLAEVPWEKGKFEILEIDGRKFSNTYELIGFKPEEGKTIWVSFNKRAALKVLYENIKNIVDE